MDLYSTSFTLEDPITRAGLEIRVERVCYRLIREDATRKAAGDRGQVLEQKVEKYRREPLAASTASRTACVPRSPASSPLRLRARGRCTPRNSGLMDME